MPKCSCFKSVITKIMLNTIVCASVLLFGYVSAQEDIGCFVPGKCINSNAVGISFPPDANECLLDCKDNTDCLYFTYELDGEFCGQLSDCNEFVETDASVSISGNVDCTATICSRVGQCLGNLLNYAPTTSEEACLNTCYTDPNCNWYTFNTAHNECSIFSDCDTVDESALDSLYGQRECQTGSEVTTTTPAMDTTTQTYKERRPTLLVFGGNQNDYIDVVDLDGRTCDEIPKIPVDYSTYYGFVKDEGSTPVFCQETSCVQFTDAAWNPSYELQHNHFRGAGAQFDDDNYCMTGGNIDYGSIEGIADNDCWSSATDTFSAGSPLPAELYHHCMVPLNSTHAFIAGGSTGNAGLSKAYLYDRITQIYTELPPTPNLHNSPACGIAKTPNGPEFIVVGMYYDGHVDIYNIEQNIWRQGLHDFIGPQSTTPSYIQWEDSFLVVTSSDESIYEYDPVSEFFSVRLGVLSDSNGGDRFMLLIDGTKLNCA